MLCAGQQFVIQAAFVSASFSSTDWFYLQNYTMGDLGSYHQAVFCNLYLPADVFFFPEDKYTLILCIHVAAENSHLGAAQYNYSRVLGVIEMISARAVQ